MKGLQAWWGRLSGPTRAVVGLGLLLTIALLAVAMRLSSSARATESELAGLAEQNRTLASELQAAQEDLSSLQQSVDDLENTIESREAALAAAESLQDQFSGDLRDMERSLREALDAKQAAETLVAELTLAYSDDIDAARAAVAGGVTTFACEWGTAKATEGTDLNSVTGAAALQAFATSEEFETLASAPEIATYLSVAATLGEDPYGVAVDEVQRIAVGCWQTEDAKLNAALYEHQGIFREAVLDAACTGGADSAFDRFSDGYSDTAVYQNWELTLGDAAFDYVDSVEARFGSIEAFVGIPAPEIQAESDRCEAIRDLISPKSSGTWNVGDEIRPGTWVAYDESDCYWARLAENGDIRDNHFGDGLRLTVNVLASDGQFEISGCTFYFANP